MKEDTVELIDYLRVIWKRKIFIIVGTLVCIILGVVMNLKSSVTYRAEAVISIGRMSTEEHLSSHFIETSANLVQTIPLMYRIEGKDSSGYDLHVEAVGNTYMVKLFLEGPGRGTNKLLLGLVNELINDHHKIIENSTLRYKAKIDQLQQSARSIKETIGLLESVIPGDGHERSVHKEEKGKDTYFMMMYNSEDISIINEIRFNLQSLREIQQELAITRVFVDSFNNCETRLVDEVKSTTVGSNMKREIVVSGVIGLTMFLFLAFFIEYLAKMREKGKYSV